MSMNPEQLSAELDRLGDFYGRKVTAPQRETYLRLLGHLTLEWLLAAIDGHMSDPKRGRFFPFPADLLAHVPGQSFAFPTADEAWAVALASFDEDATVVWTTEIEQARNLALTVWQTGDKIAARMTFKGAYERLTAGMQGRAPGWKLSPGHNPEQRAAAVLQAQASGLLTREQARELLPTLPSEEDPGVKAVAGLLAGNVVPFPGSPSEPARRFREAVQAGLKQAGTKCRESESRVRTERAERRMQEQERRAELRRQLEELQQATGADA